MDGDAAVTGDVGVLGVSVSNPSLTLQDGAIAPWAKGDRKLVREALAALSRTFGIDLTLPFSRLPRKLRDLVFFGAPAAKRESPAAARPERSASERRAPGGAHGTQPKKNDPFGAGFEGLIPNLRRRYEEGTWLDQENLEPYRSLRPCPTCRTW